MPDISKCDGIYCPIKEKCFRFTAKANDYQTFFVGIPGKMVNENWECEYFMKDYKYYGAHPDETPYRS